nr:sugar ABC transporter permease [uncultured Actinoplanes sp.]
MANRRLTLRQRDARAGIGLVAPTVLIVCLVLLVPMLWAISIAFQDIRLINIRYAGFFGKYTLDNFIEVFKSPGFWSALWTTVLYTVGATGGSILVGLIAALAVRRPFKGRSIVRGLILLPYVAPVVAVAFVWTTMLNPQFGVINNWGTRFLGWSEAIPFLSQQSTALLTVIVFETWRYYPFAFLFLMARLQAVSGDTEEAARVDGATPLQSFRYILLPQLLPTMAVLFVLRFVFTFSKFDDVYLLTGGGSGTEVVSVRVYELLTSRKDVSAACAQAVVLAIVLVIFLLIQRRATRRWNGDAQ